jgi:hypothetical protein
MILKVQIVFIAVFICTLAGILTSPRCLGEPTQNPQIGLQLGRVSVGAQGYRSGTIVVSPVTRFFAVLDLNALSSLYLYTETHANIYMSSGMSFRYFPNSVSSPRTIKNKNLEIQYSDPIKPFLSVGLSIGRVRLETKDAIGATEISANYYGPELGGGVSYEIFEHYNLDTLLTYSFLVASSDSTVEFSGSRLTLMLGGSLTL